MAYLHYFSGRTCPNCQAVAQQRILHASPVYKKVKRGDRESFEPEGKRFRCLVSCANCKQPQLMEIEWKKESSAHRASGEATWMADGFLNRIYPAAVLSDNGSKRPTMAIRGNDYGQDLTREFRVVAVYPETTLQRPEPDDVPEDIHVAFNELDGVRSQPRFAAIACRRILELATAKRLDKPKERLADRLGQLQGQGLITAEVQEWMRTLKDILNDATHGGEAVSHEQAEELIRFTNVVIELLFTYPARIQHYKRH